MTTTPTTSQPQRPRLWVNILLILAFVGAALFIAAGNMTMGAILFAAAVILQAYETARQSRIATETPRRLGWLAFAWVLCVLISLAAQYIIPAFTEVLNSLGSGLPAVTRGALAGYRWALLGPVLVGIVWQFWPQRASRLRAALIASWASTVLIFLMIASMYLPVLLIGQVV